MFWTICFGIWQWAGYIKGRARCSCVASGSAAPLLHSDCDPSLRVCVCVLSFFLYTLYDVFALFLFSPLFFSLLPPSSLCSLQNRAPDTEDIAPGLFGLSLFFSHSLAIYISRFSSHLLSFFLLFIFCKSSHFAINTDSA